MSTITSTILVADASDATRAFLAENLAADGYLVARVALNGLDRTYASENLSQALFTAAQGLALCGIDLADVTTQARLGHEYGRLLREDAP